MWLTAMLILTWVTNVTTLPSLLSIGVMTMTIYFYGNEYDEYDIQIAQHVYI